VTCLYRPRPILRSPASIWRCRATLRPSPSVARTFVVLWVASGLPGKARSLSPRPPKPPAGKIKELATSQGTRGVIGRTPRNAALLARSSEPIRRCSRKVAVTQFATTTEEAAREPTAMHSWRVGTLDRRSPPRLAATAGREASPRSSAGSTNRKPSP